MLLQLLVLTLFLVGMSLAGLGVKLLVQPHNRLSEAQISRYREMQHRGITYIRDNDTVRSPDEKIQSRGGGRLP